MPWIVILFPETRCQSWAKNFFMELYIEEYSQNSSAVLQSRHSIKVLEMVPLFFIFFSRLLKGS